jgi:Cof subfamily protein (haloacid dehalogenase superfamily)
MGFLNRERSILTKKMVFFDIDGTLYNEEKKLPKSAKESIQRLKQQGHEVAIATGRSPFNITEIRKELEIDNYVSFNGQYVVLNGQVVYKNPINVSVLEELTSYSAENQHPIVYLNHEDMKGNVESHALLEKAVGSLNVNGKVGYDPLYHRDREIYQSFLIYRDEDQVDYKSAFPALDFIRWHEYAVDVLPAGGSKAVGIQAAINHFGIAPEHVYAFGDGLNDIEMLSFVKNSVAMGNAHEKAKSAAKYITKHVDEDGIAYGLELVGLLK